MKNEEQIRLNFYALTSQEFAFKIWRKGYRGEEKADTIAGLYRNSLPITSDQEQRMDYWISFEPKEELEEFTCKPDYNRKLTQHFLYYLLVKKAIATLSENLYVLPQKEFRRNIFFVLKDYPQGQSGVWVEPFYLTPKGKFGFLLDFKFRKKTDVPFSRDVQQLSLSLDRNFRSNRNYYIDKYQKIQAFLQVFNDKLFPLAIQNNGTSLSISRTPEELPVERLKAKTYIFGNGKSDISQFRGLTSNGPLEAIDENIVLALIYRSADKYLADDLLKALKGELYGVQFNGLEKTFKLKIAGTRRGEIPDYTRESLRNIVERLQALKTDIGDSLLVPILIGNQDDEDTYYFMKYNLLKQNLPLQVVTSQLIRKKESLKWSVSNIALQIFSKLGGKAWKVSPSHEKSLIFGIGQSHQKQNDTIVKYFAYSVCTDSSGIYKRINVLGNSAEETDYLNQLKENIVKTIKEFLGESYTKYVLHIPFKIRTKELTAIYQAINSYVEEEGISEIDFVVLRINSDNKFFGFAHTNSLVPYESSYVLLSGGRQKSYLVWFEGLQYHKEAIHKMPPGPTYIEFYWSNNESLGEADRVKYLQDVLNLSGANWRGFNAKSLPVSIYYCQLIAGFLKQFPEEITGIESTFKPWFL
ncbi:MAG: hypothetical protein KGZ93_02205 [Actinobacteria bacterium]|nr:hypothetical protein [Actinomycetota bacterium]